MTKILFAARMPTEAKEWVVPLRQALPDTEIIPWSDDGAPLGVELAIAWEPPTDLFQREPGIRAVFNLGAGVDALLGLPGLGTERLIVRLEDAGMGTQMAEYALYALLRVSRDFARYETSRRQGRWDRQPDIQRARWPVGVLGLGLMGSRVARAVAALDYPVAGWSRSGRDIPGVQVFAGQDSLPDFLARTRVLINTLPLTPQTHGLLNRDTLGRLLPAAHLISMGRGEHLIDEDLLALLAEGHLAGAMLDVFHDEPLPADHPFWADERIMITPHIAAASLLDETVTQVADKIRTYLRGGTPTGVVQVGRGY